MTHINVAYSPQATQAAQEYQQCQQRVAEWTARNVRLQAARRQAPHDDPYVSVQIAFHHAIALGSLSWCLRVVRPFVEGRGVLQVLGVPGARPIRRSYLWANGRLLRTFCLLAKDPFEYSTCTGLRPKPPT